MKQDNNEGEAVVSKSYRDEVFRKERCRAAGVV